MSEQQKRKNKKKIVILLIGLGFLGVLFFAGIEFTCTAWFCTSCHEMKPLGRTWELSKHGPFNPKIKNCMKCHAKPGVIGFLKAKINGLFSLAYHVTGNYHLEATQPVVCLREGCHKLDELNRANRPDQIVKVDHQKHVEIMKKAGMRHQCMPCHRNIAHGEEGFMPDMKKDCFICHKEGYQQIAASNCTGCHGSSHSNFALEGEDGELLELHSEVEMSCMECHTDFDAKKADCEGCHEEDYSEKLIFEKEARK